MQPFPEPERKPNVDEHDQVLVGCESDRFGASCEDSCGGGLEGCSSKEICTAYCSIDEAISNNSIAAIFRCSCAAGLKGARCDEVCSPGHYGSNCSLLCGFCKDHERCNRFTGECNNGCQAGYYPPFCQQELTHLRRGLTISSNSNTSFSGLILVAPSNVAGAGEVTMYELQYKEIQGGRWTSGAFGQIEPCRENPCSFVVDGLRPDTDLAVRALLLNDNMESFDNYLYLTTRTLGQRQVSGLTVTNVTARSLRVSWTSPADGPFCVMYGCDTMLACPGMRCDYSDGMLCDANKSVLLENLFPFTRYSITVAIDDQSETISAITLATVPDAEVSDLATRHITNVTAVVRWQNTDSCAQLNGPFSNYRWELYPWEDPKDRASNDLAIDAAPLRFGATNSLAVVFRDLKPLTWHMFRVNIINALGPNPRRWSLLPFKTLHTVPEAPREPAVYRNNGTSLWLRWQKPARPYGIITRYIVELQVTAKEKRKETASPNSHCVAKVDFICHTWNGLHPDTDYIIVIRAANEYGDEPGEPTTVHGSTRMGGRVRLKVGLGGIPV
ncbi:hypothetical protein ONE63_003556 [Megalurothrips usitatus]|uniref:Fibronectin type-III domain-containing protein n=1 Tax=Megalurothrips usitatus TaxID=439358 RepID=A0AAV7X966_9NEOP|nr:hypothetical protein ONE63_003556 [Megalurothrips usitatus]